MRRSALIGALLASMPSAAVAAAAVEASTQSVSHTPAEFWRDSYRSHGKHKLRRHGQKMKRNRLTVSKRVRRKHRKSA